MNKKINVSHLRLKTENLILRGFRLTDLNDFYEYARVDGVGQMAGWSPHENIEKSLQILKAFIKEKKVLAIEFNGKVIGSVGIEKYNEEKFPEFKKQKGREIGYVLSKNYWGRGLMVEAVNRVLIYLFERKKLDFVLCGHFIENKQSQRVQEKLGFRYYKAVTFNTRMGLLKDGICNIMTKKDYFN